MRQGGRRQALQGMRVLQAEYRSHRKARWPALIEGGRSSLLAVEPCRSFGDIETRTASALYRKDGRRGRDDRIGRPFFRSQDGRRSGRLRLMTDEAMYAFPACSRRPPGFYSDLSKASTSTIDLA
jgi:hypothetical protein